MLLKHRVFEFSMVYAECFSFTLVDSNFDYKIWFKFISIRLFWIVLQRSCLILKRFLNKIKMENI